MGVVVQAEVHLGADGGLHVELYVVVEVEVGVAAGAFGQGGVLGGAGFHADFHFGCPLRLDADAAGAEDAIGGADVEAHVHEVQFFAGCLPKVFFVLLSVVGVHGLLHGVVLILLGGEGDGCAELHVAEAGVDDVHAGDEVVFDSCFQVFWVM